MKTIDSKGSEESAVAKTAAPRRFSLLAILLLLAAIVALGVFVNRGIHTRVAAENDLKLSTQDAAILAVNVLHPAQQASGDEIVLPGNTQPYTDAPIYARASGYLKRWYLDIGAHAKKGQLLAEIEAPEIDQQLQQAKADLETAKANLDFSKSNASRLLGLVTSGSVSQQETDAATSDLAAKKATVDSGASNVRRLEDLQSFEKVYAPFDGIVTARNTDTGSLIDAGANAPGKELFHLAAIDKLRVFVDVPEVDSRAALPGAQASLTLDEFPGEMFHGVLARTSNSINSASSTLLAEVDVDNPSGRLLPGAYVFVHLQMRKAGRSLTVPANTLLFRREGLRVAVARDGRAVLVPITIGRDYGDTVEVVAGLQAADNVILDPPDSLTGGAAVEINNRPTGAAAK